jgi:hypothetical protein
LVGRAGGRNIKNAKRKRTEEPLGWGKTIGGLARPMLRGLARLRFKFILTMAAYDLIRLPKCSERRHDGRNVVRNKVEISQINAIIDLGPIAPADQVHQQIRLSRSKFQ